MPASRKQGKALEAREFTGTQREQVNLLHTSRIHLLALRAGIPNACPVSKSDLSWLYGSLDRLTG